MKYQKSIFGRFCQEFPYNGHNLGYGAPFQAHHQWIRSLERGARGGKLTSWVYKTFEPRNTLFHELFVWAILTKDRFSVGEYNKLVFLTLGFCISFRPVCCLGPISTFFLYLIRELPLWLSSSMKYQKSIFGRFCQEFPYKGHNLGYGAPFQAHHQWIRSIERGARGGKQTLSVYGTFEH